MSIPPEVLAPLVRALNDASLMELVDIAHSKCAARLGVWVRVPRLVLGGNKTVEYGRV